MPYKFKYSKNGVVTKECFLQCNQCEEIKPNDQQCRMRTCFGTPFCWIHLLYRHKLRIKDSALHGKGLFAMVRNKPDNYIVFHRNDVIIEYEGEPVTMEQLDEWYGEDNTAPYAISRGNDFIDAACRRGAASLVNHSVGRTSNAVFRYDRRTNTVRIVAKRNIHNNEEITVFYGHSYKFNEPGVIFSTKTCASPRARR